MRRLLRQTAKPPPAPHLVEEEVAQLLNAADNTHDRVMLTTFLMTGIRAGELCSITRGDVGQDTLWVTGKTGRRSVPLDPTLRDTLRGLGKDHVFVDRFGNPLSKDGVYQRVRRYLVNAGIDKPKMGPHMLRHTFGYLAMRRSGNLRLVQELLGHTTSRMTERYTDVAREDLQQGYRQLDMPTITTEEATNGKS